jgi:hypothetical protein
MSGEAGIVLAAMSVPAFFVLRWDARRRPYAPCPFCRRRAGRNPGSTDRAYGRCPACHGTRERRRLLAVIFGAGKDGS